MDRPTIRSRSNDEESIQIKPETGIVHVRVRHAEDAAEDLITFLQSVDLSPLNIAVEPNLINEWLHYGSIYLEGKRLRENCALTPGVILRLHTRRKSYVSTIPILKNRIVFENEDFLVLNKPSGLPTHATLDNCIENASYLLSQELGIRLYVTHRLDVATHGLLILAKSPKAQAAINKQFAKRQVEKIYRARVAVPVSTGLVTQYMDPESRVPKSMSIEPREKWWECRMEILSCTRLPDTSHELRIHLHTGKTHQIRAQLKTLGAPINGDIAYGSMCPASDGQIDLECHAMTFRWLQNEIRVTTG
jgi:23S rRNA pseudouridine1911/1915/1917 synthase